MVVTGNSSVSSPTAPPAGSPPPAELRSRPADTKKEYRLGRLKKENCMTDMEELIRVLKGCLDLLEDEYPEQLWATDYPIIIEAQELLKRLESRQKAPLE